MVYVDDTKITPFNYRTVGPEMLEVTLDNVATYNRLLRQPNIDAIDRASIIRMLDAATARIVCIEAAMKRCAILRAAWWRVAR